MAKKPAESIENTNNDDTSPNRERYIGEIVADAVRATGDKRPVYAIAAECNVSPNVLTNLKAGRSNPNLDDLYRLASKGGLTFYAKHPDGRTEMVRLRLPTQAEREAAAAAKKAAGEPELNLGT